MSSLKSHTLELASLLETTRGALYERQRVLVRAGLLDQSEGHGPGTGVRATPASAALLLIAAMATDNLSDVEARVREIANTKSADGNCKLTNKRSFHSSLTAILASDVLANRVVRVSMSRSTANAKIVYRKGEGKIIQASSDFSASISSVGQLGVTLSVEGHIVQAIAEEIASLPSGASRSSVPEKKAASGGKV